MKINENLTELEKRKSSGEVIQRLYDTTVDYAHNELRSTKNYFVIVHRNWLTNHEYNGVFSRGIVVSVVHCLLIEIPLLRTYGTMRAPLVNAGGTNVYTKLR